MEELTAELHAAEQLAPDPLPLTLGDLLQEAGEELRAHGYPARADQLFRQARSWYLAPNRGANATWKLAQLAYGLRDWQEARILVDSLLAQQPANSDYRGVSGLISARLGRRDLAEAVARSFAADQRPYQLGAPSLYRARIAAVLGDRDTAVTRLREAFAKGTVYDLWLHRDPDLESLRGFPPYEALVRPKH
jgi:predicted Zn-dependent protease